ncbi:MAG: OadG family protein [bacterium]
MTLALAYPFLDGILTSVFCIIIVYAILYLITIAVRPLKFVERHKPAALPVPPDATPFRPEDITDDDMMAAIITAAIDYREETHQDIRIVSAKEIK